VKLENEFEVPVSVERAWGVLLDVERITPCLPGAQLTESRGDGEFAGIMKVKLGPITSTYSGTIRIEEADEAGRRAVMRASARDARGQGTASATITSTLVALGESTRVRVETDMRVTGPAARMGRGVMQDVSAKLLTQFADCLAAEIGRDGAAAEPAEAAAAAGDVQPPPVDVVTPGVPPTTTGGPAQAAESGTQVPLPPPAPASEPDALAAPIPVPPGPAPQRPTADVLDLGEASREAVLKRAAPALAALLVALLVALALRRRR